MGVSAFATAISLAGASTSSGIVSLNLCTDELVLLLADPARIRSVSYLSHAPEESALWRRARRYGANDGSMLAAAAVRPALIVTMGESGRDRTRLAAAIGARLLVLPYPATLRDVARSVVTVGRATGGEVRAGPRARRDLDRRRRPKHRHRRKALDVHGPDATCQNPAPGKTARPVTKQCS